MIDPERLEDQRRKVEEMRIQAERLEAANRLRAAQLEAVRLGLRVECSLGCGREIGKQSRTGICHPCQNRAWIKRKRAEDVHRELVE